MPGAKALSASHCYARDPQSMARSLDPLSLAFLEAAFPEYKLDHCVEHQLSHCVTHWSSWTGRCCSERWFPTVGGQGAAMAGGGGTYFLPSWHCSVISLPFSAGHLRSCNTEDAPAQAASILLLPFILSNPHSLSSPLHRPTCSFSSANTVFSGEGWAKSLLTTNSVIELTQVF